MGRAEAIIFDLYNTLLDNETDEERWDTYFFLSLWLSYHGVKIPPVDLRRLYLDLCRKEVSKSTEPHPDIEIGKVFSGIMAYGESPVPPPSHTVSELALLFRIFTTNRLSPFPGVIAMLDALKGKAKLAIASNAQRLFTIPELTRFKMAGFFDAIVFSSDLGACKPNPKLILTALEALSVPPTSAVFVGDNLDADILAAQRVGIASVWINRGHQQYDPSIYKPDYEVRDETTLTKLLLSLV